MSVETVINNEMKLTTRQVKGAQHLKELMESLMLPTTKDLKTIVQFNLIKNNPGKCWRAF